MALKFLPFLFCSNFREEYRFRLFAVSVVPVSVLYRDPVKSALNKSISRQCCLGVTGQIKKALDKDDYFCITLS